VAQPTNIRALHPPAERLAVALALLVALAYTLIAQGILPIGDLTHVEGPAGIMYTAAGCYLLGGLLILLRRRWLWIVGAIMNGLIILFFVRMYQDKPAVLFSPGGLVSKAAQLLLELILAYLIVTYSRRSPRRS